ncbi:MAG TPA: FAD-dependent oxidoreductase [Firmicutes bacterium]|nr:FAD-dependent oxidoreductase [Bacillota bacterium]
MSYTLKPREIPMHDGYDVIVVGGGPAGVAAAYSAAREGANTLLIEATGALGGMSTMGMVPAWCPFSDKEKIIYRGLAERIFNAGKAQTPFVDPKRLDWVPINPEVMKVIYDDLMNEVGVKVLFGTVLSSVDAEDGTINAIIVTNKAGLSAYSAKVYIDCTGDGDLSAYAGAEFHLGDDDDPPSVQMSTLCFSLGGVNDEVYRSGITLHGDNRSSPIWKMKDDPRFPYITDSHFCNNPIGKGAVGFNAGHLPEFVGTDPEELSKAYMIGRKKAHDVAKGLAEYYPEAFADAYVLETAPLMGIRESRRIVGDYTLTADDYMSRATFPDEISRNSYYLDVHRTAKEKAAQIAAGVSEEKVNARYGKGESHGIPYRCLTPKGMVNLLCAGRIISCDRRILGSVRVMPNCFTTGEAAGLAAALAASGDRDVHAVDVGLLRDKLRQYGAYFK